MSLKEESSGNITPSTQSLIEEFKSVEFEKVRLEEKGMSTLIEFLPFLANEDSKSEDNQFREIKNE